MKIKQLKDIEGGSLASVREGFEKVMAEVPRESLAGGMVDYIQRQIPTGVMLEGGTAAEERHLLLLIFLTNEDSFRQTELLRARRSRSRLSMVQWSHFRNEITFHAKQAESENTNVTPESIKNAQQSLQVQAEIAGKYAEQQLTPEMRAIYEDQKAVLVQTLAVLERVARRLKPLQRKLPPAIRTEGQPKNRFKLKKKSR